MQALLLRSFSVWAITALLSLNIQIAIGADIFVTSNGLIGDVDFTDNGNCSIYEAMRTARLNTQVDNCVTGESGVMDTITLPEDAVFTFTQLPNSQETRALETIESQTTIVGNGATLVVDRDDGIAPFGILNIRSSVVFNPVFISDLSMRGGGGGAIDGGCIRMRNSEVTLSGMSFDQCSGKNGGAIYLETSARIPVSISDSSFTGNSSSGSGGGLYFETSNRNNTLLSITDSDFTANTADANGGGLAVIGEIGFQPESFSTFSVFIKDSKFSSNTATIHGGAMHLYTTLSGLVGLDIVGNQALLGGGINTLNDRHSRTYIVSSTIRGNTSPSSASSGGIQAEGTLAIFNSTLYGNEDFQIQFSAAPAGLTLEHSSLVGDDLITRGAIRSFATSTISISNSVLARGLAANCVFDKTPTSLDVRGSSFDDTSCSGSADSQQNLAASPDINGGSTLNLLPLEDSSLIDMAEASLFTTAALTGEISIYSQMSPALPDLSRDQRGETRPSTEADIGSVEVTAESGMIVIPLKDGGVIVFQL